MARLLAHFSSLCRPEGARGQVLTRPLSALMRGDDDSVAGPGWYESSLDLQRGLLVRESGSDDRLLREWHEARRRLAVAMPRQRPPVRVARADEPAFDLALPAVVPAAVAVAVPLAVTVAVPVAVPAAVPAAGPEAPAPASTGVSRAAPAAAPRVRYTGGLDFVV